MVGIKNFTSVKVKHGAKVAEPLHLDDRTYIDRYVILYLPVSDDVTGLPKLDAESLLARIDEIIDKAKEITR